MNLSDFFHQLPLDLPEVDFGALATELLDKLRAEGETETVLLPLLEQALRQEHRRRVRDLEHGAAEQLREAAREAAAPTAAPSESRPRPDPWETIARSRDHLDRLLSQGSWRHHQQTIHWRTATRLDHQARVERLERQAAGIGRTAGNHRAAISLLDATGAGCLGEIADRL